MIAIIAAVAANGVIGRNNDLPWYLPADLRYFKQLTTDHTVIMGRNTYESIVTRLNGPLPNRRNIVVSTTRTDFGPGFEAATSITEALARTKDTNEEVFIIGGAALYAACLDASLVDTLYLTEVHTEVDGDVYFPEYDKLLWRETSRKAYNADDKNEFDYDFVTYRRSQ